MSEIFDQSTNSSQEVHSGDREYEEQRFEALKRLVAEHLDQEDVEFLDELGNDEEAALSYVYGRLLELGEDPDEVLSERGITDEEGSDEV